MQTRFSAQVADFRSVRLVAWEAAEPDRLTHWKSLWREGNLPPLHKHFCQRQAKIQRIVEHGKRERVKALSCVFMALDSVKSGSSDICQGSRFLLGGGSKPDLQRARAAGARGELDFVCHDLGLRRVLQRLLQSIDVFCVCNGA